MCDLKRKSTRKEAIGWKVVAVIDGEYYSPAMGIKYPKKGEIPVPQIQKRISSYFDDSILRPKQLAYNEEMIGRTAIFLRKRDAEGLATRIRLETSIEIKTIKAKLTKDLMCGDYCGKVIAGRHIEYLE